MQELAFKVGATGLLFLVISFVIAGHSSIRDSSKQVKFAVCSMALISALALTVGLLLAIWSQ